MHETHRKTTGQKQKERIKHNIGLVIQLVVLAAVIKDIGPNSLSHHIWTCIYHKPKMDGKVPLYTNIRRNKNTYN